jgi:hypothetical protein
VPLTLSILRAESVMRAFGPPDHLPPFLRVFARPAIHMACHPAPCQHLSVPATCSVAIHGTTSRNTLLRASQDQESLLCSAILLATRDAGTCIAAASTLLAGLRVHSCQPIQSSSMAHLSRHRAFRCDVDMGPSPGLIIDFFPPLLDDLFVFPVRGADTPKGQCEGPNA